MQVKKFYITTALITLAGYGWFCWSILMQHTPAANDTVCLIKNITGIPCPSCGATRGVMKIINGEWGNAFILNPFAYLLIVAMVALPVLLITDLLLKKRFLFSIYQKINLLFSHKPIAVVAVALVCINWTWNIIKHL